jgi:hemoglobin
MDIKPDISSRKDIELLLRQFYESVKKDPVIGIIFTEVVQMDWEHHIPLIADFWETILLDNPVYHKNAMAIHHRLNEKFPLKPEHFTAWLALFFQTIDQYHQGPVADLAKKRAKSIAELMQFKMNKTNSI